MNTRKLIIKSLNDIFIGGKNINHTLSLYSKDAQYQASLGSIVNGVIRMKLNIDYYINEISAIGIPKIEKVVLNILRAGIYELEYTDNENYGVVNSYVELAKEMTPKSKNFVNAILRNFLRKKSGVKFTDLSTQYSFPAWMIKKWIKDFGHSNTVKLCKFFNIPAKLTLKTNTLKITTKELIKRLKDQGVDIEESNMIDDCLKVDYKGNVTSLYGFNEGLWHIQSEPSCLAVDILDPKEKENILDLCAAPGTKTCYIAQKTNDNAKILACDISESRIKNIQENIDRLGITSIKTQPRDGTKAVFDKNFDKILIDAPCSNTGVLAKRADARWNKKREDISNLANIQYQLFSNAAKNLNVDGEIVYSTCSIEKEENTEILQKFLKEHKNFKLIIEKQFLPFIDSVEGFYIAKVKKLS